MTFVWRAALVMCIIFAGCMFGVLLQHLLPTQHLADAKSAITTIQGLVGLLLALVLGLLVWTSYGVYSQQQSETHTLGSQVLQLDLALERYGPTADRGRELLRQELIATRERFWGGGGARPARLAYCQSRAELRDFDGFFAGLKPSDDEQRHQLDKGRQLSASMIQTHYLMSRQLLSPIPKALLISVVCWATLLFTCIGASSGVNARRSFMRRWAPPRWRAPFISFSNSASRIWGCSGYRQRASIRSSPNCPPTSRAAVEAAGRAQRLAPAAIHFIAGASRRSSNRTCDARHGADRRQRLKTLQRKPRALSRRCIPPRPCGASQCKGSSSRGDCARDPFREAGPF
jgi:hypothetical protein